MRDELYNEILMNQNTETENISDTPLDSSTWLTFNAGGKKYAIASSLVQEILRNNDVFPIPFVPPYIKGVLNSYGKPFAVLDISLFFYQKEQNTKLYMILKDDNHLALQIDDLMEFHTQNEISLQKMVDSSNIRYFSSALTFEADTIPVLNMDNIISDIKDEIDKI